MPRRPSAGSTAQGVSERFAGFAPPTSNTTYCPNQFFDVCLPHCSRGAVRLVAYLIRKTLGWCDTQGNPQAEQHAVSYADLIRAGISRDMIRSALDEAAGGHFIRCVREPEAKKAGQAGASGLYELQWEERGEYVKDPRQFRGFFAGEGNRTYVPNAFFDRVVANEKLAVVKVVGSVIRLSIGFANKWGHRRRHVSLSFRHIQNYARLRDRTTLSQAVRHALAANYLERVEAGYFDPRGGKLSRSAVYALKWLDDPEPAPTTAAEGGIGRKNLPAKNDLADRSENPTGIGRKTRPEDRSENPTGIEIKQGNNTYKQQDFAAATFEKLRSEGFDAKAAQDCEGAVRIAELALAADVDCQAAARLVARVYQSAPARVNPAALARAEASLARAMLAWAQALQRLPASKRRIDPHFARARFVAARMLNRAWKHWKALAPPPPAQATGDHRRDFRQLVEIVTECRCGHALGSKEAAAACRPAKPPRRRRNREGSAECQNGDQRTAELFRLFSGNPVVAQAVAHLSPKNRDEALAVNLTAEAFAQTVLHGWAPLPAASGEESRTQLLRFLRSRRIRDKVSNRSSGRAARFRDDLYRPK